MNTKNYLDVIVYLFLIYHIAGATFYKNKVSRIMCAVTLFIMITIQSIAPYMNAKVLREFEERERKENALTVNPNDPVSVELFEQMQHHGKKVKELWIELKAREEK